MNYTNIFYIGPEMNVCGYYNNYKLIPGKITVESWIAEILIRRGYGLSLNPNREVERNERNKKYKRKVKAGYKEIVKQGELKCQ